jgi:hypothetical protein
MLIFSLLPSQRAVRGLLTRANRHSVERIVAAVILRLSFAEGVKSHRDVFEVASRFVKRATV